MAKPDTGTDIILQGTTQHVVVLYKRASDLSCWFPHEQKKLGACGVH